MNEFKKYFRTKYAFAFNSGRSSLTAILQSLDLEEVNEVLLQAFTCNAAANPILWSGLKPVYVDCDEDSFNIDIEDLKRKITPKSKVILVQHTFGLPAEMDKILALAQQNNLILIEDCAHSLGAEYKDKKIGAFGKAAFFSFSRDKIISSVYGGMVVTNDDNLAEKINKALADLRRLKSIEVQMDGKFKELSGVRRELDDEKIKRARMEGLIEGKNEMLAELRGRLMK